MQMKLYRRINTTICFCCIVEYVDDLMEAVIAACQQPGAVETPGLAKTEPPALCADLDRPDKQEAIAQHRSRFGI